MKKVNGFLKIMALILGGGFLLFAIYGSALAATCYNYYDGTVSMSGCTYLYFSGSFPNEKYWHKGTTSGTTVGGNFSYLRAKVTSYDYNQYSTCNVRAKDTGKVFNVSSVQKETPKADVTGTSCEDYGHNYCGYTKHWWAAYTQTTLDGGGTCQVLP
ncbi:MAG: hypothetical protein Fur0022_18300 [Anaerolineales bacterium]